MSAEDLLLAHYARVSDAPDAIPELRKLLVEFAVTGRLVSQNPTERPASTLIEEIKTSFGTRSKRMQSDTKTKSGSSEIEIQLPCGWIAEKLGNIIELTSGQHLQPPEYSNDPSSGIPYITGPSDFTESGLLISRYALVKKAVAKVGQLLLTVKGSGVGKTKVCPLPEVAISRQLMALNPLGWNLGFLELILSSMTIRLQETARSLIPGISREDILEAVIALPPVAEQSRIVSKFGELMALCDRLAAARLEREARRDRLTAACLSRLRTAESAIFRESVRFVTETLHELTHRSDQIDGFRQAILDLAVRGKLIPQCINRNEAAELFKDLASLAPASNIKRAPRKGTADGEQEGVELVVFPEHWVITQFDKVAIIASGVAKGKSYSGEAVRAFPYLRVANVQRGYLDLIQIKTMEIPVRELNRYRLLNRDVLMTEGGDWDKLGRAAIWNDSIPDCIHQNHIFRIRSVDQERLLPEWIALVANSPFGRSYFASASKQTTNLASINMTQLKQCPLPLPGTVEQGLIIERVGELMTILDRLEASLTARDLSQSRLLGALVHGGSEDAAIASAAA
jgi:type I restriction enzyme S subunit